MWWHTYVIPVLERLWQEDCEFEDNLRYIACLRPVEVKMFARSHLNGKKAGCGDMHLSSQ
jgi:hypothetical protein